MMNKSLITNLVSIFIIFTGYFYKDEYSFILVTGVFALSGSITNWIAIHMLFEKVPFIYGSGIIPRNFLLFKKAIKDLILKEFFSRNNVHEFTSKISEEAITNISKNINYENIFEGLTENFHKWEKVWNQLVH